MKLDPLLVLRVDAGAPIAVGIGPYGTRLISTAAGGTFEGARLSGKVLPNGGDWILVDGDDVWHTDVRLLLETDDGGRIYVQYHGLLTLSEKIRDALAGGGTTNFGEGNFIIQPRFETDATAGSTASQPLARAVSSPASWSIASFNSCPDKLPRSQTNKSP